MERVLSEEFATKRRGESRVKCRRGQLDPFKDLVGSRGNHLLLSPRESIGLVNATYESNFNPKDLFKFAIRRHPLDRAVSMYFFIKASYPERLPDAFLNQRGTPGIDKTLFGFLKARASTFSDFVNFVFGSYSFQLIAFEHSSWLIKVLLPQSYYLYNNDDVLQVDYLMKYEKINEEWEIVKKKIGATKDFPWYNKTKRDRSWEKYYTPATKKTVQKFFERDFDLLGY